MESDGRHLLAFTQGGRHPAEPRLPQRGRMTGAGAGHRARATPSVQPPSCVVPCGPPRPWLRLLPIPAS